MIEALQQKIGEETEALLHELHHTLPRAIEKAVAQGDLRENSEYSAALERQEFVKARLEYLVRRSAQLGQYNVKELARDRIGFGTKVKVRDVGDGEIERFTLLLGEDLDFANNEISLNSPIGKALKGKRKGDVVQVTLPAGGVQEFEVLDFETLNQDVSGTDD